MTRFNIRTVAAIRAAAVLVGAALLALLPMSCATTASSPHAVSMPAARAGLRPEYRVFYDELQDYGDWVLVEPYGFVFRPRTRFNSWSPYYDGFWSPSDSYGWVWVSGEPFGWATYHYGAWINDPYQGYVWVPGLEWAPAWVAWSGNDNFVGWAALAPSGNGVAGNYNVVPRSALGSTDLSSKVLTPARATAALKDAQPIENFTRVDRVLVNRGPSINWVEQVTGPLNRTRVEDLVSTHGLGRSIPVSGGGAPSTVSDEDSKSQPVSTPAIAPTAHEIHKAAETAAQQTRTVMQQKQAPPDVISRIRVTDIPGRAAGPSPKAGIKPARRDTLH